MNIIKVHSEWDLGIPELYETLETAKIHVRGGLQACDIEETLEELEEEGLILFEWVNVVTEGW